MDVGRVRESHGGCMLLLSHAFAKARTALLQTVASSRHAFMQQKQRFLPQAKKFCPRMATKM